MTSRTGYVRASRNENLLFVKILTAAKIKIKTL
jgi:hypothetical protein